MQVGVLKKATCVYRAGGFLQLPNEAKSGILLWRVEETADQGGTKSNMQHTRRIVNSVALPLLATVLLLAGCAPKPTPEVIRETVEVTRVVVRVVTATPTTAEYTPTPFPLPALSVSVGPYDSVLVIGMDKSLNSLVDTLQGAGFAVHTLSGLLTPDVVSRYGVILFCNRLGLGDGEVALLKDWIRAGGGAMFLHIGWGSAHNPSGQSWREAANAVLSSVAGIKVDDSGIQDPKNEAWGGRLFTRQIHAHPATDGVRTVVFDDNDSSVTPINPNDPRIVILVRSEEDAYNDYYTHKPPIAVAAEVNDGRVIAIGCRAALAGDIGMGDNQLLALQVVEWLAHRR
jgi:hypothetical protein